jgi:hypothetical protein
MCSLVAAIGGGSATAPLPSRLSLVYWDGEFATAPLPSRLSLVYWGGEVLDDRSVTGAAKYPGRVPRLSLPVAAGLTNFVMGLEC